MVGLIGLLLPLPGARATEDKLGTIHFVVPGDPVAAERIVRGVKLLHHMMYVEADREFAAAVALDPDDGFGYWGRAMAIVHPLWADIPDSADLERGRAFIRAGQSRPLRTGRERGYLGAMEAFFRADAGPSLPARFNAADAAWADLAARYPDDLDAAAFAALYHLAPARFLKRDRSHRLQLEAAEALTRIAERIPDHPGALHYRIHALDYPLLAGRALEVCEEYGSEAPDVPHALHMPTHIYTRLGLWDKSADFNERSAAAARRLWHEDGALNSHLPHALDYLAYACLQAGQYGRAESASREIEALHGPYQATNRPAMAFAFASIPARLAIERRDWKSATHLQLHQPAGFPWGDRFLYCDGMVRFARALGAVRSGDREMARAERAELAVLRDRISAVIPGSYWESQAEVQVDAIDAWLTLAEGRTGEAIAKMRRAVETEGSADKEAVTPGEIVPAGELLGELLEEAGHHAEAQAAFEAQLALSPRRFNGLVGAARAAEGAGDLPGAAKHWRELLAVAAKADPGNERVEAGRAFLAHHPEL
jgi:tetratricopeptide (TPR) repeat protein